MLLSGRIKRMVKETDLPFAAGSLQFLFQPVELLLVHVIAVESKEANTILRLKRVVTLPAHVEWLVADLPVRNVVVPQGCVKFHAGRQKRLVGFFKLVLEIPGGFPSIHVVAEHDHELKRESGAR